MSPAPALSPLDTALAFAGLTAITVLTRSFFFLSPRELPLPAWAERALRQAPLAALAAVVLPEVLLVQGQLPAAPWQDARTWAALAATAWFLHRRDLLGTIAVGMAVLLGLRLGLGL